MRTVHLEMEKLSKHIVVIECRWSFSFHFPLDVRSSCGPAGNLGSLHHQPFVGRRTTRYLNAGLRSVDDSVATAKVRLG